MNSLVKVLRFGIDAIKLFEKGRWWDFTLDQLMEFYSYIQEPAEYAKRIIDYQENED